MSAAAPPPTRERPATARSLWGPVVVGMGLIFALSSMSEPPAPPQLSDKLLHALGYGALALATVRATSSGRWTGLTNRSAALAWIIASVYGASDELHQRFVPGRFADLADLAADSAGAALAVAAVGVFAIIQRSRAVPRAS